MNSFLQVIPVQHPMLEASLIPYFLLTSSRVSMALKMNQIQPPAGPHKFIGVDNMQQNNPCDPISQQAVGSSESNVRILPTVKQVPKIAMGNM